VNMQYTRENISSRKQWTI